MSEVVVRVGPTLPVEDLTSKVCERGNNTAVVVTVVFFVQSRVETLAWLGGTVTAIDFGMEYTCSLFLVVSPTEFWTLVFKVPINR